MSLDREVKEEGGGGEEGGEVVIPFDASEIRNPALARFYSVLESLALGEAIPPAESTFDGTMPTGERTERAVELAKGLAAAVGGALDDGEGATAAGSPGGGARGAAGGAAGGGASARARRGNGDREVSIPEIEADARAGLNLTVEELQRALVARGLKKSGRKDELMQRLREATQGGD